jgi:hypothetical protein
MNNKNAAEPTWQERFGLTACPASVVDQCIPPNLMGVAVVYAPHGDETKTYLVIESRAGDLLGQVERRMGTAGLPTAEELMVAFVVESSADFSPEELKAACRRQVIFAGEIRRALRPAMR